MGQRHRWLGALLAVAGLVACTYEIKIDRAAENLDFNVAYSPCSDDDGGTGDGGN